MEIKLTDAPSLTRGTHNALANLGNSTLLVVTPSAPDFPQAEPIRVCSVATLPANLQSLGLG